MNPLRVIHTTYTFDDCSWLCFLIFQFNFICRSAAAAYIYVYVGFLPFLFLMFGGGAAALCCTVLHGSTIERSLFCIYVYINRKKGANYSHSTHSIKEPKFPSNKISLFYCRLFPCTTISNCELYQLDEFSIFPISHKLVHTHTQGQRKRKRDRMCVCNFPLYVSISSLFWLIYLI